MSGIIIRRAMREDVPAILEIYNDAVLHTTASADYEPRTLQSRMEWFDNHEREGYPIFVAVNENDKVIGWSSLSHYHERVGYRFTAEDSVYVAANARGQGVGKQLVEPLITSARDLGLHAIIASIGGDNEASIRLHAALGFEERGHLPEIIFKFEKWIDVVYMVKLLP
ncbi:MAG TPA: GNAT family N-acetyltransferase [Anaerolineae bacterium]|nr:GNAT family N-acetyltransferase [Anaerolineae bacterium]